MPTQQQLDNFWYGTGGSAGAPTAGAYVTMKSDTVDYLYWSDSGFRTLLQFVQTNKLNGFAQYARPAGSNEVGSGGVVFNGPSKS